MRKYYLILPILLILSIIFASQTIMAADLDVEVIEKNTLVVVGIDEPATFTFFITSNENITDNFQIYSLVEPALTPKEFFSISSNGTKELEVELKPKKYVLENVRGFYVVDYEIKGQQTGFFRDQIAIKVLEIKDLLKIEVGNINPGDNQTTLSIENLENFDFGNLTINAESSFFDFSDTISISPNEQVNISLPIDQEKSNQLIAGTYDLDLGLETQEIKEELKLQIKYLEKGGISVSSETTGLVVRKKTITKVNEGNFPIMAEITDRRDILSRLFTSYSENPVASERKGFFVDYRWERELAPKESFVVTSVINYTAPFVLLVIVVLIALIVKIISYRSLTLNKRVTFVKTKGGEFALRVRLRIKQKKNLENAQITDTIPRVTKLYEKAGTKPDKVDHQTRKISWNIARLNAGEERNFSYIIYSKLNVLGKFELPAAKATYESEGKSYTTLSNKTSFMAESADKFEEE